MKKTTSNNLHITDLEDGRLDINNLPFSGLKNEILGTDYVLSLVFAGEKTSQKLNKKYRDKDTPTNILSFPLEENEGEIVLCVPLIEEQASDYNRDPRSFSLFLFVHGCFHLAGYEHGEKMEKAEKEIRERFDI